MDASGKTPPHPGKRARDSAQQPHGQLYVDEEGHEIIWQGRRLDLSPTEFSTLSYLASHAGQTVSFEHLLQAVWHTSLDQGGSRDQVRGTVKRLRQSLGEEPNHPRYLTSVRGVGYRLELGPQIYDSRPSLPSLPRHVKALVLVGLALVLIWLLWVRRFGDPYTLVWYQGHQVPIGLLHILGRGSSCGQGPGGINCFDSKEEMEAALGEILPSTAPNVQEELGSRGDVRIPPPE